MRATPRPWREIFEGGSLEAEEAIFRAMATEMQRAEGAGFAEPGARLAEARARPTPRRMYTKTVVGVTNARLIVDPVLPPDLAVGHFLPRAVLRATLRFSNASRAPQADGAPDMRGLALRLSLPQGGVHDLVLASLPVAVARNACQFFELTMAALHDPETPLARLAGRLGVREGRRVAACLKASFKLCPSLALQRFWSGGAYLWNDNPVRLHLRPLARDVRASGLARAGDALRYELAGRLATHDVRFRLALQRYVDEKRTPIEDAAVKWHQSVSRPIEIATLVVPKQDLLDGDAAAALAEVDALTFSPWNTPPCFRPLGSLNRLRRFAYPSSGIAQSQTK